MDAKFSSQIQNKNKELQVPPTLYQQFKLPNDWDIERRCRSKRGNRRSHNDKPSKSSGSQKEHVSGKVETAMLDPSSIPGKIKWVLTGPGGIVWNPFMDDYLVPEFIKQKWSETFVLSIIDRL
ncbi:hypothetical protein SADUNF_Sadunf09G0019500 [Salix dunnii]|uniref:Uncharacterized protein n=1 Tax=Salix dunnii TaxID=1413687 RepID=A0A835JVB9_9ROSI|nr:hypothetical protein SADUNF_Sadunf09G0019500 [Salix dunnii]